MSQVRVDRIVINVGVQKLTLTPEELRELQDMLNELCPKPSTTPFIYPMYIERPEPLPYSPDQPYWEQPIVTCDGKANILSLTCSTAGAGV